MGQPIGANPHEAMAKGGRVADLASRFRAVSSSFRGAFSAAEQAAGEPEVVRGYRKLGPQLVGAIDALQRDASDVGHNVAAAGGEAAKTDTKNAEGFDNTRADIPHPGGWR